MGGGRVFGGWGGGLLKGDDYLKFFRQREAIVGGRRLIEGRLLFEEIRYLFIYSCIFIINFF